MKEGFYSVSFAGLAGAGIGIIVLDTGMVVGADAGGVSYDGNYAFNPATNTLDGEVVMTAVAGTWLVTGATMGAPVAPAVPVLSLIGRLQRLGKRKP